MKSIDWQGQQIYRATKVGEELKFAGKGRGKYGGQRQCLLPVQPQREHRI